MRTLGSAIPGEMPAAGIWFDDWGRHSRVSKTGLAVLCAGLLEHQGTLDQQGRRPVRQDALDERGVERANDVWACLGPRWASLAVRLRSPDRCDEHGRGAGDGGGMSETELTVVIASPAAYAVVGQ
jgi:hypothetical protein